MKTNWEKNDFIAYLLIYFMEADLRIDPREIAFIKNKVGDKIYDQITDEIVKDKDFARINKIQNSFERLQFNQKEKDELIETIHELFEVDGKRDLLEKNILLGINRLLNLS